MQFKQTDTESSILLLENNGEGKVDGSHLEYIVKELLADVLLFH